MQGYIINIKKSKDEDLYVYILTQDKIIKSYRFYGQRHSVINIGYKIDFELEDKMYIQRLKDVIHINFNWLNDYNKVLIWQSFIKIFYKHLYSVGTLDSFYFLLLEKIVKKFSKQNPKRVLVEAYLDILDFEGRLNKEFYCIFCENLIAKEISLVKNFLPSHKKCSYSRAFEIEKIKLLFEDKQTIILNDEEVNYLYNIMLLGL